MKQIADAHQDEYFPVSGDELRKQFRMEGGEYLADHGNRTFELGIAEEYPAEADEVEGDNYGEHAAPAGTAVGLGTVKQAAEELVYGQCHSMKSAPYDKFHEAPCQSPPSSMVSIRLR